MSTSNTLADDSQICVEMKSSEDQTDSQQNGVKVETNSNATQSPNNQPKAAQPGSKHPGENNTTEERPVKLPKGCEIAIQLMFIVVNVCISVGALIAIGLGIWLLTTEYGADEMKALTGSDLYLGGSVTIILGGLIAFLFGVTGCAAGIMEMAPKICAHNSSKLSFIFDKYIQFLSVLILIFIIGTCIGFIYKHMLNDNLREHIEFKLKNVYNVNYNTNLENRILTDLWNQVQKQLKCCGVIDGGPGKESWRVYEDTEFFEQQQRPGGHQDDRMNSSGASVEDGSTIFVVPRSCCDPTKNVTNCKISKSFNYEVKNATLPDAVYKKGCLNVIFDLVEEHVAAIAGFSVAICAVLLTDLILAGVVFKKIMIQTSPVQANQNEGKEKRSQREPSPTVLDRINENSGDLSLPKDVNETQT